MPVAPCPKFSFRGYYPTFPFNIDLRTDAPRRHYDDLVQKRSAAYTSPITVEWSFTELIEKKPLSQHPGARPMPSFAREGGMFRFQLAWAEQAADSTNASQCSQVWVANVSKAEETETIGEAERVILKIVQPSMLPLPSPTIAYRHVDGPADQLAFSEDVIYRHLQRLQGSYIPYFFGTFQVNVPSGEEAYVLMLEYINGETLESWVEDFDDDKLSVLPTVINSTLAAFRELREEKVLHTDMEKHLRNILIDTDGRAVVIDFVENAIFDSADQVKEEVRYRSGDEDQGGFCLRVALKLCLEYACTSETKANLERWLGEPGSLPRELEWPHGPEIPVRDGDLMIETNSEEEYMNDVEGQSDGEGDWDLEWRVQ